MSTENRDNLLLSFRSGCLLFLFLTLASIICNRTGNSEYPSFVSDLEKNPSALHKL